MKDQGHKAEGLRLKTGKKNFFLLLAAFAILLSVSLATASSRHIEDSLKKHIKANYPWTEVDVSDLISHGELPEMQPEKIMVVRGLPGRTVFQLEFKDSKRITVTAEVKAFDRVVMSRRALNKGYQLKDDDTYTTLMDIRRIPKGAVKDGDSLTDRQLMRPIPANTPLVDSLVSETPMLRKGHRVVLKIEAPGLSVSAIGEIKENSYVGNYVKVVNVASKKVITGFLTDENTVKVVF